MKAVIVTWQVRLAWSGQLPSQVWSCFAKLFATKDDPLPDGVSCENEVTKLDYWSLCLPYPFANILPCKAHVSLQVEARESKTKKMELFGGSICSVRELFVLYFLNNFVMSFVKKTQSMNNLCVLSQEDVGHLCSVIPAVEELLFHGVGNKDQK